MDRKLRGEKEEEEKMVGETKGFEKQVEEMDRKYAKKQEVVGEGEVEKEREMGKGKGKGKVVNRAKAREDLVDQKVSDGRQEQGPMCRGTWEVEEEREVFKGGRVWWSRR